MAIEAEEQPSWKGLAELTIQGSPRIQRRTLRAHVALTGGMRRAGAAAVSVRILDLSVSGFRAETHLELEPGVNLWVRLPGLESRPATVAWVRGHIIGCAFVEPLHPAVFSMIAGGAGANRG